MPDHTQAAITDSARPHAVYAALEERVMARDQVGASAVYYDLVKSTVNRMAKAGKSFDATELASFVDDLNKITATGRQLPPVHSPVFPR